jgi:hypothetical protein
VQFLGIQLLAIRAEQDRLHEIRSGVAGFVDMYPAARGWRAVLALCDARSGRFGDAHKVLRSLDDIPRDGMWLGCMAVAAHACVEAGDETTAEHLVELLTPHAASWAPFGWAATWGPVALWLAELCWLLGRFDDARAWIEIVDARGVRAWGLRVKYVRARLGAEPAGTLGAVAREARELGMKLLAAQAKSARAAVAPPA